MTDQSADLDWRPGDVPVSRRFDDPYFSLDSGLEETGHVFHAGNGLPARFRDGFRVAELGFGTGLNLLATLKLWRESGARGRLHYTTFELYPMPAEAMIRAQRAFPALAGVAAELAPFWSAGARAIDLPDLAFRLVGGDARATLPGWAGQADAWFLDGFAPAKNPELWEPALLAQVFAHTAPGGTAASYTAAGHVRRALAEAGFTVTREAGFGRKRHMTRAERPA